MQTTQTELKDVSLVELKDVLSANDYEQFRRMAVMQCMISNATWSHWTTGKHEPENKYKHIIDGIAARFGLVVFGTKEGGDQ